MIPEPFRPDIPVPGPAPEPGGRRPSPAILAYKAWEELEELKKQVSTLVARFDALERRVATLENPRTV